MLGELDAHQQAAIRAALNAESSRRRDLLRDQVLRDGGEVVVDHLAMRLETRVVPCGAELSPAANVGQNVHAAALEPELADGTGVEGSQRHLEAAIGIQQGGVRAV